MSTVSHPQRIGKYEILSILGRGGMGVVYKARDPIIDRIVAVKTILIGQEDLSDDLPGRLRMEARSAGRLQHQNIVTVYDFGQENDVSFIVMEYVEGINLARIIEEARPVSLPTKIDLLVQMGGGLGYAHDHGVTHRDMKPSNICVTSQGIAKILDFGLARFDNIKLTKTGYLSGTIAYMSPERFSGVTSVQDDIFALGAIAFELLTGQRAFPGSTPPEIIAKIISPIPPLTPSEISELPSSLDQVILKALAKDVDHRYQTAADFVRDLRVVTQGEGYRNFISDPARVAALQVAVDEFTERFGEGNVYAGPSSNRHAEELHPTLTVGADPALHSDFNKTRPAMRPVEKRANSTGPLPSPVEAAATRDVSDRAGLNDAVTHVVFDPAALSGAPTQLVRVDPLRHPMRWMAIPAAIVIVAAGGFLMTRRKAESQPALRPSVPQAVLATRTTAPPLTTSTPPASDQRLSESADLQLATARSLAEELRNSSLNSKQRVRLSSANARARLAEKKFKANDDQAGTRLITEAIDGYRALIDATATREKTTTAVTQPPVPAAIIAPVAPPPPPPVIAAVRPQPALPVIREPAAAPPPGSESSEKDIPAFIASLEDAYQTKNVAFFREHSLRYNDQLGTAIRNSPSIGVVIHITRIDLSDAQHATVYVLRTDTFPDGKIPPGKQNLVYHLQRDGREWKIVSITR